MDYNSFKLFAYLGFVGSLNASEATAALDRAAQTGISFDQMVYNAYSIYCRDKGITPEY